MQELNHFTLQVSPTNTVKKAQFSLGLPLQQGLVFAHQELQCQRTDDLAVQCAFQPLAFWPDNSVKWIKLNGQTCSEGLDSSAFYVAPVENDCNLRQTLLPSTEDNTDSLVLSSPSFSLKLNRHSLFSGSIKHHENIVTFTTDGHISAPFDIKQVILENWHYTPRFYDAGTGEADIIDLYVRYLILANDAEHLPLEFDGKVTYYRHSGKTEFSTTIRNPNPAEHDGGTWDLGDKRSAQISDFLLRIEMPGTTQLQSANDVEWQTVTDNARYWQRSSAGKHWNSPNHLNKQHNLSVKHKNSLLTVDGIESEQPVRLTPQGKIDNSNACAWFKPTNFWQNFPTAFSAQPGQICWHWFHTEQDEPVELQPGEQKTHRCDLILSKSMNYTQAAVTLNPAWIEACLVLPWFSTALNRDPLQALIDGGIESDSSFFSKREHIDEFGWRHFGDLYADHETAEHSGNDLFASHYNNQYDPLLGFLKQWLLSGDRRWRELADNLAQHIIDIDIYHCDNDKPEYNRGLFWHTDHYLPAETATHRTYSKHHKSDAYQDHAGGGGPGGQHCYTTGLQLYYFLTGNLQAKQAVLGLTDWIQCVYESDNTMLGLLLQFKNRHRKDLKNILTGSYPFDRGTANYMNALLDSYEITGNLKWLNQVAFIIKQSIDPHEDIAQRELDNIEENWFYTVFLQAVCRYLEIQKNIALSDNFYYAKACLLHYAAWMAENEYSYLLKPEILEYPNQTWTAQDLRKIQVLSVAATYADQSSAREFRNKASELKAYCVDALKQSDEKYYTRILALLMQNYGTDTVLASDKTQIKSEAHSWSAKNVSRTAGWLPELKKVIGQFSVKYEWQQLQKRIPSLRRNR